MKQSNTNIKYKYKYQIVAHIKWRPIAPLVAVVNVETVETCPAGGEASESGHLVVSYIGEDRSSYLLVQPVVLSR